MVKMTGYGDATNAFNFTAVNALLNLIGAVGSACPCFTIGTPEGESQQSNSMRRIPSINALDMALALLLLLI